MTSTLEGIYATLLEREHQVHLFGDLDGFSRRGAGYIATCPFHGDTWPTLIVAGDRPEYFCFVCSARGDWIDYIMRRHDVGFEDACGTLARQAGCEPPACTESEWADQRDRAVRLESFMEWCIAALWGDEGRRDFHSLVTRGYSTGEIRGMGIGHFPGYDEAFGSGESCGSGDAPVREASLYVARSAARGVLIPYRDGAGRLMGLVCKDMARRGPGSYTVISTWQGMAATPFLVHRLGGAAETLVVEGFFDALLIDQIRIVPVIGTGMHGVESGMIDAVQERGCRRFTLVVGNTGASVMRARKAASYMLSRGIDTRVLPVPGRHADIDEYIRSSCLDGFVSLLGRTEDARRWLDGAGGPI